MELLEVDRADGNRRSLELLLGAAAVSALVLLFFSSWWNRYLSPASGGEITVAFMFERGMLPYRDYFSSAPPGMILAIVAISNWCGQKLLAFWAVGAVLRLVGAVCLYLWLCRVVRPAWGAISVVSAFVLSSVDIADIPFGYNHVVATLAILGGFCLSVSLDGGVGRRIGLGILAGTFLGAAALVKQTTGLISIALLVTAATLCLASRRNWRGMTWSLGSVGFGIALPLAGTLVWFLHHGMLAAFLEQTFTKGPSSKGGLVASLVRPVTLTARTPELRLSALLCLLVLAVCLALWAWDRRRGAPQAAHPAWWLALAGLLAGILVGRTPALFFWELRVVFLCLAYLAMVGCLAVTLWSLAKLLAARLGRIEPDIVLLAVLGFGCAYSLSMSWPAFEVMIFPGVALLLALALEQGGPARCAPWIRGVVVAVLLVLVAGATARKHVVPFYWGRWVEPPLEASTVQPDAPELRGFLPFAHDGGLL
jgi:Glycosyltransferase family 87